MERAYDIHSIEQVQPPTYLYTIVSNVIAIASILASVASILIAITPNLVAMETILIKKYCNFRLLQNLN